MQVTLGAWQDAVACTWCDKSRDCVVATFSDGFLKDSPLCFKCLETAMKVRSRQAQKPPAKTG